MLSFEVALPLGVLAFYLYDCGMLLHDNELVYVRNGLLRGGAWSVLAGRDATLFGRRMSVPAPLLPWALLFRAFFSANDTRAGAPAVWPEAGFARALRPLQFLCTGMLALLLLVLPAVSLGLGAGVALLVVFALAYLSSLAAFVIVYARRAALGLDGRALLSLGVDALACPPFAINLVRKISLRRAVPGAPLAFAAAHLDEAQRSRMLGIIRARTAERA
jgi:hypothetical protein